MARRSPPDSRGKRHLVIFVNGLFGNPRNFKFILKRFMRSDLSRPERGIVFVASKVNKYFNTRDGIDICGERLIEEMRQVIALYPELDQISFIAHSLGGLICRYAAGRLFDPSTNTICGLTPRHFITLASPHLGCSSEPESEAQVPFIHWWGRSKLLPPSPSVLDRISFPIASGVLKWTGRQLFLVDHLYDQSARLPALHAANQLKSKASPADDNSDAEGCAAKDPLLLLMTRDVKSGPYRGLYLSALKAFASRTAFANVSHDKFVGWANASVRSLREMPQLDPAVVRKAKGIVREDPIEAASAPPTPFNAALSQASKGKDSAPPHPSHYTSSPPSTATLSTEPQSPPPSTSPRTTVPATAPESPPEDDVSLEDIVLEEEDEEESGRGLRDRLDGRGPKHGLRMFAPRKELDRILKYQRRAIQSGLQSLSQLPWRRIDVSFQGAFMAASSHDHVMVSRIAVNWQGIKTVDRLVEVFEESEKHAFN